ncbi:MAG: hypothetical protein M3Q36_02555, partial [bacterium]|nr:hypothetical protein [bacterium]
MYSTKIKSILTIKRTAALLALLCLIAVKMTGFTNAQSVTQGYGAAETLQRGMIVGLIDDDATKVESLNVDNLDRILGVVVAPNDSPITLSDKNEKVFVATVGRYEMLVSDQEGTVNPGEYVTASALNGIGMKATFEQSEIVGRALEKFDGTEGVVGTSKIKDTNGGDRVVSIGRIEIDIG